MTYWVIDFGKMTSSLSKTSNKPTVTKFDKNGYEHVPSIALVLTLSLLMVTRYTIVIPTADDYTQTTGSFSYQCILVYPLKQINTLFRTAWLVIITHQLTIFSCVTYYRTYPMTSMECVLIETHHCQVLSPSHDFISLLFFFFLSIRSCDLNPHTFDSMLYWYFLVCYLHTRLQIYVHVHVITYPLLYSNINISTYMYEYV